MIYTLLGVNGLFFYSGILVTIAIGSVAVIIGALKALKKNAPLYLKLLILYICCSMSQGFISIYYSLTPISNNLDSISANIFTLLEFFIFNIFFFSVLHSKYIRRVLTILLFIFPAFCLFFWFKISSFYAFPYSISVVEAFCFLLPCSFYFYEIFTKPPIYNLATQAPFWITTGMFFYFITIIPSFLIMQFFEKNWLLFKNLAIVGFFSTSILFLLIIKAFLCKSKLII